MGGANSKPIVLSTETKKEIAGEVIFAMNHKNKYKNLHTTENKPPNKSSSNISSKTGNSANTGGGKKIKKKQKIKNLKNK